MRRLKSEKSWKSGHQFDVTSTHAILTPVFSVFGQFFIHNHKSSVDHCDGIYIKNCEIFWLIFLSISNEEWPNAPTPTQMLKSGFLILSSQEIGSSRVPFQMIFEALLRFKFHSLGWKF